LYQALFFLGYRQRPQCGPLVCRRCNRKRHPYLLPGLSGLALWLSALVLLLKGYRIIVLRSIDLPSNWISFHPGVKEKMVESIYGHLGIQAAPA
jgi:hypothetical protein